MMDIQSGFLTGLVTVIDQETKTDEVFIGMMSIQERALMTPKVARRIAKNLIRLANAAEKSNVVTK